MQTTTKEIGAVSHTSGAAPAEQLRGSVQHLVDALAQRALSGLNDKVGSTVEKLSDVAGGGDAAQAVASVGTKALKAAPSAAASAIGAGAKGKLKEVAGGVKEALTGGKSGKKGGHAKITNIVESIEVGVPIDIAYDQWTRFSDFPSFMKKVEGVEQVSDEKLHWKAQVFWSHRSWESTIVEQVPEQRIVWRSKGDKGYVDGAVTFHELAPDLTKIIVVLEYHPQGLFERTGNLWRAQGRRARLELKHFQRHVMTNTVLHPDELEGWRGEIRDSKVVSDSDGGRSRDGGDRRQERDGQDEDEQYEPPDEDQDEEEPRDEAEDGDYEDEDEDDRERDDEEPDDEERDDEEEEEPVRAGAQGRGQRGRERRS